MKKVILRQEVYDRILSEARRADPEEACGLIAGRDEPDGTRVIERVWILENIEHSSEHFTITPQEQLRVLKEARAEGYEMLGNWHSHPETPSRPSDEDKRLAYDSSKSYMILSLQEKDHPVLHSFHIEGTDAEREELEIR